MSRHAASCSSSPRPRSLRLLGALVLALALALLSTAPHASAQQLGLINAGPSIGSQTFIQNGTVGSAPSEIRNGDFWYSLYFTNLYTDSIVRLDFNYTTTVPFSVVLASPFIYVPLNSSGSTEFVFTTYCLANTGSVGFNLVISIHEQANTTVTIPFRRDCTPPVVRVGLSDIDDRGIYNGTTVLWTPPTDNPTMLTRSFFVSVSPSGAIGNFPFSFDIDSSDAFIGSPIASPSERILSPGIAGGQLVTVSYMCVNNGRIDLNMTIKYGWSTSILLKWTKTCNPNYLGTNATFWNVGTSSGASDIVAGGVAQGSWASQNTSTMYANPQQRYTIWFSYNLGTVDPSWVTCQNKVNDLFDQGENGYTIAPPAFATLVPPVLPSSLSFVSVCRVPNALMVTEFEFECAVNGTSINPLKFFFQWVCTPPLISLGSSSGATDAISSSVPSVLFQPVIIAPTDVNVVYLYLSVPYSPLYVNATIAPVVPGVEITPNEMSDTQLLRLTINCATVGRALNSTLYVYYGFLTPLIVPMELQCGSSAPINSESSGGISGAGVAAIVIVVLVFVACVAGCVYNLNVAGKRGWEIVPGYTQFESCKDRVMGPQRYTPQMEDYDQSALTGGYGSTSTGSRYQNDL